MKIKFRAILRPLGAFFLCGFLLAANLLAQGTERKVVFSKITLQENATNSSNGFTGLSLKFDVGFSWVEEDFFKREFALSYRVEQNGSVILRSTDADLYTQPIRGTEQTVKGKKGMLSVGNEVFIPYLSIPLESGPQRAEIIFSLSNDDGTYTDCHRSPLNFTHQKIVRHNLNEQGFTISNFRIDYAAKEFSSNNLGMRIKADVGYKYNREQSLEDQYEIAWLLRNGAGKVLFDSRKDADVPDKTARIQNGTLEGKPGAALELFGNYYAIAMDGPGEAEVVVLLLGAEGGPKEIYAQKMLLNIPPKYNFEEQGFILKTVVAAATKKDGVSGIAVQYSCAFKLSGVMRNHEMGKYFFYAAIFDANGKLVIAPERAPTQGAGSSHLQDGHLPGPDELVANGSLFIPLHLLNLPAGSHQLKFALMVSDVNLKTKFPVVGTGKVSIVKPADLKYLVGLESLEMIDANYDSEIIPISSKMPELQYLFAVGEDQYYASEYNRNSLSGIPGSTTLHLSEGDPINLILYDVDSGFFNNSDLLGRWKIDYQGKGSSFFYELSNAGQVVSLKVKVTKVE